MAAAFDAAPIADAQGTTIALKEVTPWPEPVDGAQLLDEIVATHRRFVVMSKESVDAVALWTLFAPAHEAFDVSPLLGFSSPLHRCGKTREQTLVAGCIPRALPTSNISPPALFRAISKYRPVLIIDEADAFLGLREEIVRAQALWQLSAQDHCHRLKNLALGPRATVGEGQRSCLYVSAGAPDVSLARLTGRPAGCLGAALPPEGEDRRPEIR